MPTELPTVSILESSGLPTTELPTELFTISRVVGSLVCIHTSHVQPMGSTLHFLLSYQLFHIGSGGLPTELHTVSIYWSSGQPNLHGKFPMGSPWAAHSTAHWAAHFFIFGSTGLPTVSIYGSSGQPNVHDKIPTGISEAAKWADPLFFCMGRHVLKYINNMCKYDF